MPLGSINQALNWVLTTEDRTAPGLRSAKSSLDTINETLGGMGARISKSVEGINRFIGSVGKVALAFAPVLAVIALIKRGIDEAVEATEKFERAAKTAGESLAAAQRAGRTLAGVAGSVLGVESDADRTRRELAEERARNRRAILTPGPAFEGLQGPVRRGEPPLELQDQARGIPQGPAFPGQAALEEQQTRSLREIERHLAGVAQSGVAGEGPLLPGQRRRDDEVQGPVADMQQIAANAEAARRREAGAIGGIADAWREVRQQQTLTYDLAISSTKNLVEGGLTGISDALGDIILEGKSAKDALKEFATSFLSDLARIALQLAVVSIFQSLTGIRVGGVAGALHGGIFGGRRGGAGDGEPLRLHNARGARGMLHGGIASGPSLVAYGEGSRAEAFVPLQDGRTIPVSVSATNRSGGGVPLIINIYTADGEDGARFLRRHAPTILGITQYGITRDAGMQALLKEAVR